MYKTQFDKFMFKCMSYVRKKWFENIVYAGGTHQKYYFFMAFLEKYECDVDLDYKMDIINYDEWSEYRLAIDMAKQSLNHFDFSK